jgi:hypothetical protein
LKGQESVHWLIEGIAKREGEEGGRTGMLHQKPKGREYMSKIKKWRRGSEGREMEGEEGRRGRINWERKRGGRRAGRGGGRGVEREREEGRGGERGVELK